MRIASTARSTRALTIVAAFTVLATASACSSDSTTSAAPSSPRPTLPSEVQWADDVCHASASVSRALTEIDAAARALPTTGTEPFAKTRGDLLRLFGVAGGSTQGLVAAIERTPDVASSPYGRAADLLARPAGQVRTAYLRLAESTEDLAATTTTSDLRDAVGTTTSVRAASTAAAARFEHTLTDEATTGAPTVRAAFAAAPSCAGYVATD